MACKMTAVACVLTYFALSLYFGSCYSAEYVYDVFNDEDRDALYYDTFPDDFKWSSATSSYQIEGAWNEDGKGPSIWDTFCHEGGHVYENHTGDVACDSYHKYKEDIALMANLGLKNYRFSIAWSRVLPTGKIDSVNEDGIAYYNNVIDELLDNGIDPMVTLYHWDLPQGLHDDYGGWMNESIINDFNDYAKLCFERFGDRVKFWITFNEPWIVALLGYESGVFAPGINEPGTIPYVVGHNLIKSHAEAWHTYDDQFRSVQKGVIGITLNSDWSEPHDRKNYKHIFASERAMQFSLGWFGHPIYKNGDYPEIMKTKIAEISAGQGLPQSRLPEFTEEEKVFINHTGDFFGLNHYSTNYVVNPTNENYELPGYWGSDVNVPSWKEESWPQSASSWLKPVPWGIRQILVWIHNEYDGIDSYVTENGVSTHDVYDLSDEERMKYYKSYINEVLKAIKLDGANCKGYTAWSLLDNFEWAAGYSERFGMHYVDFSDDDRPREVKDSAKLYADIIADNGFIEDNTSRSLVVEGSVLLTAFVVIIVNTL
ncbi:cytosolic beta-glucosidase-like [Saccoglossus kowalevskii]|uniref:beta-glucosidase n=1 Tax=Saccoglossus kowalevskii TaxID=10224 RepID=A0ABM0GRD5_SACKO|nr:PREDICTED: lactase-phlorizin hydrolase-like [Saccoglossus kowalevskii]